MTSAFFDPTLIGRTSAEAAAQAESLFRALLESAPDAMVIIDTSGRITLVNEQTERLFGYPRAELLDQPLEVLVPERFRAVHAAHREAYFRHPHPRPMGADLDLYALHRDGTEFPVEISLSPLQTAGGLLVSASIRDITERKRLLQTLQEKNLELASASRAKDRFLTSMSHELRTPLNAILGFTGTLLMKLPGPLNPDQEKQLLTVQANARHLLALINDLLDLAKIEAGRLEVGREPVVLQEVIHEVEASLRPLAEAKSLRLDVSVPEEDVVRPTDRRAVHQILLNLANNAIKFTDAGSIRLNLSRCPEGGGFRTDIAVIDTGVGIAAEDKGRLFQAFTQVDPSRPKRQEGTGLGLYLSHKLAELLGARLTCESELGRGSTFSLVWDED